MIEIKSFGSSSEGNCYHISDGRTPIILEAGIKYKDVQRAMNFQMSNVAGCLVTHEHGDHSKAIKDFLKAGIDVYTSQGAAETFGIEHHRLKHIKAKKQFKLGTWTILPFDVQHDAAEPLGFLLANQQGEKLIFATDTYYLKYKFKGLTHIMIECNYSMNILNKNIEEGNVPKAMKKRLIRSHFSLENVKNFLLANDLSKVQEIWLLHMSNTNGNAELFKREIQAITGKLVIVP